MINTDSTDVIISTRIRLARNLSAYPFPSIIRGRKVENDIATEFMKIINCLGDFKFYSMRKISDIEKASLVETYVISALLSKTPNGAVAVSSDGLLSAMFNEEDHLREQCMVKGLDFGECYKRISKFDKILSDNFNFACACQGYYYTACPTNLGTGMRASVMLFLPALTQNGQIDDIVDLAKREGLTVRGALGEGSSALGYYYQLSNDVTVGNCQKIMERVCSFALKVSDDENDARYEVYNSNKVEYADRCLRALGALTTALTLSYEEFTELISYVKLGVSMGFIKCERPTVIDDLTVTARKNTLFKHNDNSVFKSEGTLRAHYVKETLRNLGLSENLSDIFTDP